MSRLYRVQVFAPPLGWATVLTEARGYCLGYLERIRDTPPPRLASRVVDAAGTVHADVRADEVGRLGMAAGLPRASDYVRAAVPLIAQAERAAHCDPDGLDTPALALALAVLHSTIDDIPTKETL